MAADDGRHGTQLNTEYRLPIAWARVYEKITTPCGEPSAISEGVKPMARSASSNSISIGFSELLGLLVLIDNSLFLRYDSVVVIGSV